MGLKGRFIIANYAEDVPGIEAIMLMNIIKKLDGNAKLIRVIIQFLQL